MDTSFAARRYYYIKRIGVCLIVASLVAMMTGCGPSLEPYIDPHPTIVYNLNISSTAGGSVIDPGEGMSQYYKGTVVDLVATSNAGYRFDHWTGDVNTIESVGDAETTITMQNDYEITANFELIPTYRLTMAVDPDVGGTATDLTDEPPYAEDAQVTIRAEANLGYHFVNWMATAGGFDNPDEAEAIFTMPGEAVNITARFEVDPMVATGSRHTVGLRANSTLVAVGDNASEQCRVGNWTNIIEVAAGVAHTVGLKNNSTVLAVGDNKYGQCDVGDWEGIIQISTGNYHTVGLNDNSTAIAVGLDLYGQCDVGDWVDIIQVAAGEHHTVGVKSDGTVVAVGWNLFGQCNVADWEDIVQVTAGAYHTVGLKSDGTVVAVGWNNYGQCGVGDWVDVIQVAAGEYHTVGLKSDGTVVAVGSNNYGQCGVGDWVDIIQVAAGGYQTIGLKFDGTVVAVGDNTHGQCDVGDWMLK
jgi:hypothetical protein